MSELQSGIVKWFDDDKGFGFIENPDGADIFLHFSQIETEGYKTVEKHELVYFELRDGPKGLYAARVTRSHVTKPVPAGSPPGIRKVYHLLLKEKLEEPQAAKKEAEVPISSLPDMALSAHRF